MVEKSELETVAIANQRNIPIGLIAVWAQVSNQQKLNALGSVLTATVKESQLNDHGGAVRHSTPELDHCQ